MTHSEIDAILPAIAAVPCFAELDLEILTAIADAVVTMHYETDQVVFLEGDRCAGLGIVRAGRLKGVRLSSSGREQIVTVLGVGEIFNAASVFAGAPNPVTMIALEPSTVWLLPTRTLNDLQDRYPALTRGIAQSLAVRVLHLVDLVEDLSLRTVEMRLAHTLLKHAQGNIVLREAWATQAEMSARLGTVTYVLNRVLRSFEEEGLIDVERDRIHILDPATLAARADSQ